MTQCDDVHVFICLNKKIKGKCCSMYDTDEIFEYLRSTLTQKKNLLKNKKNIKIVKTSCLGKCAFGPNIYIVPEGIWYTFSNIEDIDEIINKHLINGEKVLRLINKGIHSENP